MDKITFCIPSKSNLRYLKNSIKSIRENSHIKDNDIVVYIDADTDGTEEWLISQNIKYAKNTDTTPKGIAYGYNRCIELAETEVVCMFHADMYMAKDFDLEILKYLQPGTVVSGTRIEPPLHPPGKEKIVENFGMYPEDFQLEAFNSFVERTRKGYSMITTKGIFAPWAVYKSDIVKIGMHDEYFHSYHEDSDMFNRFILAGYNIVQTWEGFVYHLTCRGGKFQDGIEQVTKDQNFHNMTLTSARHYIRKWGSWIKNDEYQCPIIPPKYNIVIVLENSTIGALETLEPWCDKIFVDCDPSSYINREQPNTKYDLKSRIGSTRTAYEGNRGDIEIHIDSKTFNEGDYKMLQQISEIIKDSGEVGEFELGNMRIVINGINEMQKGLIISGV